MIGEDGDVLRQFVVGANAFVSEVKIIIIMEKRSSTVGAINFFIIDVMFVISASARVVCGFELLNGKLGRGYISLVGISRKRHSSLTPKTSFPLFA